MFLLRNLTNFYSKRKLLVTKNDLQQILRMKSVLVDEIKGVMTIGINRPSKKNALDMESCLRLKEAIEDFENNNEAKICVLHGVGGNFCSGFDISEFENQKFQIPQMFPTGKFFKKPIIAALDGYAVASGFELALMCDLRVMEENAKIGFLSRRFGIPLMNEGTVRIQQMIGTSRAMDLVLTGRLIDAKEALEWGIVNRPVAVGTAFGQSINLAISLLKFSQDCLLHDRKSLYFTTYEAKDFQEACEFERKNINKYLDKEKLKNIKEKFDSGIGKHGKFYNLTKL